MGLIDNWPSSAEKFKKTISLRAQNDWDPKVSLSFIHYYFAFLVNFPSVVLYWIAAPDFLFYLEKNVFTTLTSPQCLFLQQRIGSENSHVF